MTVAVPDFGALAGQQKTANDQAANQTNLANRPNQYDPLGSMTWGVDANGNWTQSTGLTAPAQGLFDTTIWGQQNLGNQIAQGVDYGTAPAMPNAGFGADQQVINAWQALQQPGVDKQAAADRARAAAMGITLGSTANNDVERNIGVNQATSTNQGILQGVNAWNQTFQNQLAARQQGVTEANSKYNAALQGSSSLGTTRESLNPNKWATSVPASAVYTPSTIYGAAQDTFNANRQNENADIAAAQAKSDSYINALKAAGGSQGITGVVNGLGSLWNMGKDIYSFF